MKKNSAILVTAFLFIFFLFSCFNSNDCKAQKRNAFAAIPDAKGVEIPAEAPVFFSRNSDLTDIVKGNPDKLALTTLISKEKWQLMLWRSNNSGSRTGFGKMTFLTYAGFTVPLQNLASVTLLLGNLELSLQDILKLQKYILQNPDKYTLFTPELQDFQDVGIKAFAINYSISTADLPPLQSNSLHPGELLSKPNPSPPRQAN